MLCSSNPVVNMPMASHGDADVSSFSESGNIRSFSPTFSYDCETPLKLILRSTHCKAMVS